MKGKVRERASSPIEIQPVRFSASAAVDGIRPSQELEIRALPANGLTEERIRERAYQIWQARGGAYGDAISDWLEAERELAEERANTRIN